MNDVVIEGMKLLDVRMNFQYLSVGKESLFPRKEFNGIERNGIAKKIITDRKYIAAKGSSFFEKAECVFFVIEKEFYEICSVFFSHDVPRKITIRASNVSVIQRKSIFEKLLCILAAKKISVSIVDVPGILNISIIMKEK